MGQQIKLLCIKIFLIGIFFSVVKKSMEGRSLFSLKILKVGIFYLKFLTSNSNVMKYLPKVKTFDQAINDFAGFQSLYSWIISLANAKALFKIILFFFFA